MLVLLIHGAYTSPWHWHRLVPHLEEAGCTVVVPELPCDDPEAGIERYVETVEAELTGNDLAGSMREGLLALLVGVGLKVMNELIEEELTQLVGPKGKNDRARGAKRHGSRRAQVVLGGRKVPARRLRPRTAKRQGGVEVAHLLALRLRGPAPGADRRARAGGALDRRYRAASSPPPPRTARCRARQCRGAS